MTWMDEIAQQPEALRAFCARVADDMQPLSRALHRRAYHRVVLTGMGSSYYACHLLAAYLRRNGVACCELDTSELLLEGASHITEDALLIVVSQSGESPEVLQLIQRLSGFENVICVTNYPASRLYRCGATPMLIHAGTEYFSSTKSYTNTLAALACLGVMLAEPKSTDALVQAFEEAAAEMEAMLGMRERIEAASAFLSKARGVVCVGSGYSYANASHLEIICEEVMRLYASRYTAGQFIHGPIELIGGGFMGLLLDSAPETNTLHDGIANSIHAYGGSVFTVTNRADVAEDESQFVWRIRALHPLAAPLVEIIPVELAINHLVLKRGGRPGCITRVVKRMAL